MLILADENFPRSVVEYLRVAGHDVVWAGNDFPGSSDKDVLERAETDARILFTLDRDFWQIAIQRRERMSQAALVTPWGIDTLPAGRSEAPATRE